MANSPIYQFPESTVKAIFLGKAPGSQYSALYYTQGEAGNCLGSVNAGNAPMPYVGGGGINAVFANLLNKHANQDDQAIDSYTQIHQDLYNHAATGSAHRDHFPADSPLQYAYVLRPIGSKVLQNMDGAVFIDVFKPGMRPYSNANNYAMIYIIPPNGQFGYGYDTDQSFLAAVKQTAANIIKAVADFNKTTANNHNLNYLYTVQRSEAKNYNLFSSSPLRECFLSSPSQKDKENNTRVNSLHYKLM